MDPPHIAPLYNTHSQAYNGPPHNVNAEGHKGLLYSFGDGSKHHLFKTMRTVQLSPSIQPYDYKRIEYPKEDDQNKLSISKLELGLPL